MTIWRKPRNTEVKLGCGSVSFTLQQKWLLIFKCQLGLRKYKHIKSFV